MGRPERGSLELIFLEFPKICFDTNKLPPRHLLGGIFVRGPTNRLRSSLPGPKTPNPARFDFFVVEIFKD